MHFRSRGRVAAVSWISKSTGLCISRCSQPGKGFGLTRDQYDEELLEKLAHVGNGKFLMVFDARPKLSAIGNRLTGKGFESSRAYPFSKTYYCNIENIHAVRDSYDLMIKAALAYKQAEIRLVQNDPAGVDCSQDSLIVDTKVSLLQKFHQAAHQSKWYQYLSSIMINVNLIVQTIISVHQNVMIHCSDGWDRTSQLSSLSMILLDPYYRTLKGFIVLIEKEWLSFGHMFATRNRLIGSSKASKVKDGDMFKPAASGMPYPKM